MKKIAILLLSLGTPAVSLWAQADATAAPAAADAAAVVENYSPYTDPTFYGLLVIATILLVYIFQLQHVLVAIAQREHLEKKNSKKNNIPLAAILTLLFVGSMNSSYAAADYSEKVMHFVQHGFGNSAFNAMFLIIVVELGVVLYYHRMIRYLTVKQLSITEGAEEYIAEKANKPSWWDKFNGAVEIAKEESIMTDHDYDGIRELDNALPPWWKYGFYFTIVWGIVYLIYFHMSSGPSSAQEYQNQMADAQRQIEEYRKNSKNLVDETNVVLLTDASELQSGAAIFQANCVSCHGASAEGKIGPNLTDQYWKHGGDIKDLFKTVKLGVSGTGMKSWKSDLSASQIAQVTSYILSLQGTNPANPKAPEGDLYLPAGATASDSTATAGAKADSIVTAVTANATPTK